MGSTADVGKDLISTYLYLVTVITKYN